MMEERAFDGLKVIDFSQGIAGPHCGLLLAQHGAEVIKVEPLAGDWGREIGATYGDYSSNAVVYNRGKKSIALDLKHPDGLAAAKLLVKDAAVVIENNRPGIMKKFDLDEPNVRAANPTVIYVSVTGFGQVGPNANLPATDSVMQAYAGFMSINKDARGVPQRLGMLAIDVTTGLYAFQAAAAALYTRATKGKGAHIETSLMEAISAFQTAKMVEYQLEGDQVQSPGVPVGTFKAKDGFINVNARRDKHFLSLCKLIERDDLATDPRFETMAKRAAHDEFLTKAIQDYMPNHTVAEWNKILNDNDILNAPVHSYGDLFKDPHIQAINGIPWIDHESVGSIPMPPTPGLPHTGADDPLSHSPSVGEHTAEILNGIGYNDAKIAALEEASAVAFEKQKAAPDN